LVLGGICLLENQVHHVTQELDAIARRLKPEDPDAVEFHASETWSGRSDPWNAIAKHERQDIIKEVLGVLANSYSTAKAFACAVHKQSFPNRDPMEMAFEDLCSRFDIHLRRCHEKGDNHEGLIILDSSAHETSLQSLSREFRRYGTQWNSIRHIAEVPLFVDSRASRCVQVADHVAYSVFRRFQAGDTNYLDIILSRFDYDGTTLPGLAHKELNKPNCMCPACMSRKSGGTK